MNHDARLGNLLHSFKAGILHKGMGFLCALMVLPFAIFMVLYIVAPEFVGFDLSYSPDFIEWITSIPLYLVAAIIFALCARFWFRIKTVLVYEHGLQVKNGPYYDDIYFADVAGISTISIMYVLVAHGKSPNIAFNRRKGASVTIAKHSGELVRFSVPRLKHFAQVVNVAYTYYMTWNLTSENIHTAEISFGPNLQLTGGEFVFRTPAGGTARIPYGDVAGLEFTTANFRFMTMSGRSYTQIASITYRQGQHMLNLDILFYIIYRMPGAVLLR